LLRPNWRHACSRPTSATRKLPNKSREKPAIAQLTSANWTFFRLSGIFLQLAPSKGISGMATLLVLHGPNLNLLGTREPGLYGATTLEQINLDLQQRAREAGHHLLCLQSNAEYELIERIHAARAEGVDFILINPAAFTHTSVALRDALLAVNIPFIEIHLSNVHKREAFRQHSYFSDVAVGVICGLGASGYHLGLQAAIELLEQPKT
jgi:3-dehydroquinate dehydratase-2